jgi:2-polyprenyl-3-methyl-5-hydroxy-6-metoxy-1,4-benzoquinol methylase
VSDFDASRYDVRTMSDARQIILTPEGGATTDERWKRETPYLVGLIEGAYPRLDDKTRVLDFGCGIGRIARELIRKYGCWVYGVDASANMRALAASYVADDRFAAISPLMLDEMGRKFDLVLAIWVLQHVRDLDDEVSRLVDAMTVDKSVLVVVNNHRRAMPSPGRAPWIDDGADVAALLDAGFRKMSVGSLDAKYVPARLADETFYGVYIR